MRFFAALLACALVMGACSQSEIEPASDVSGGTRAPQDKIIVFHKVVQVGDEQIPAQAGQFKFELWGLKKNGKGEAELLGSFETDENGDVRVNFSDDLKGQGRDKYYFTEVFDTPEEAALWVPLGDQPFTMQANMGAQWDEYGEFEFGPEGPTIVNIPVSVEPEVPELGEPYKSVTLTNEAGGVHPNHNHFCYATLTRAELVEGVTLDMVTGNGCDKIGEAFVKFDEYGKVVVTFDGVSPEIQGFARTELVINDKNPNSSHNITNRNEPIDCPAEGDVIYLFVHLNPVQLYL